MVEARVVEEPVEGVDGAGLGIGGAVHHPRHARVERGAAAHRARLDGGVERGAGQPIISPGLRGRAQREDLGMRGGVTESDGRVVSTADDLLPDDDDRADRNLAGGEAAPRFVERGAHPRFVSAYTRHR